MRFTKLFPSVRLLFRRLNFGNVTRTYNSGCEGAGKKGAVVCVYKNNEQLELTPCGQEVDHKCGGKISQQLNTLACELKLGKSFAITEINEYSAVAISCIGPRTACYDPLESLDEARENVRWGVGAGVKLLKERGCAVVEVDPCAAPDAAAEAAELAAWGFDVFKTEECRPPCHVSAYQCSQAQENVSQLWVEGSIRARAQNWARCLSDMPANKMTPVDLAQAALDALCHLGVSVQAHDREWLEAQRMRAFLAVAKGSCDTPMFLQCSYKGAGPHAPPVLLAAKGVTFDSGGLCLKECHSMTENRGSMAGAAVVLAAFEIIAKLKLPINVAGVIPICENMVSGQCMKVGDVVTALNGLSIQIENTDMEGRLMMADALVYGQSIYKPSLVIDVATFTQGVLMATGGGAFGCFSNSEEAWRAVQCAGAVSGDRPWRFPLWQYFHKQITNDPSVDLRNKGSGHATPCLGAAFLKNFVCGDWVHMDITGVGKVAHSGAPPYLDTCRMTGRPTRTLAVMIQQIAIASCQSSCPSPPPCNQPCTPSPPQNNQPPCSPPEPSPPNTWLPCPPPMPSPGGPCPPTSPPCRPQPPTSPPCGPQPPTCPPPGPCPPPSSSCGPQPPTCPPPGPCPPPSSPCGPQPPTCPPPGPCAPPSSPCGPQPPTCPPPGPCPPPSSPCGPQPPTCPPPGPCPPPSSPCGPQPPTCPPPSSPCGPQPPTCPSPGPCLPPSSPCGPQPPTCPSPGPCLPRPPPCGLRPPTCPAPPPVCTPPGPRPPTCPAPPPVCTPPAPRPPTCPAPPPVCTPPAPRPPTCPAPPPVCTPPAPRPPTCPAPPPVCTPPAPRPPTCPAPPPVCTPPAPRPPTCPAPPPVCTPPAPRPPTCPAPPPVCTPPAPRPPTCPAPPPVCTPPAPRPPTCPAPPPVCTPPAPRPPTCPAPPPVFTPPAPRPPTCPAPPPVCTPPAPRPPTCPAPPPVCTPPAPRPPTCPAPPGQSPYETCPPSCLPGQPSTPAPCQNYTSPTCVSNSLTALMKHKCR